MKLFDWYEGTYYIFVDVRRVYIHTKEGNTQADYSSSSVKTQNVSAKLPNPRTRSKTPLVTITIT